MLHAGPICVKQQVVLGPQGKVHVRDERLLFLRCLAHHLSSPYDVLPVVRLEWCHHIRPCVPLGSQVVDFAASVCHSIDLDTTVALSPVPDLVEHLLVLHFLVARKLLLLFLSLIITNFFARRLLLGSGLRKSN